jgi:hypothetical protein
MNPGVHAQNSARKYGGEPQDYLEIHRFLDSAKEHLGDIRHRLILHNAWGVALCERLFGDIVPTPTGYTRLPYITNSAGLKVFVRDIAQDHIKEDMFGEIPSLAEQFSEVTVELIGHRLGVFGALIRGFRRKTGGPRVG